MQDPGMLASGESSNPKPRKKKVLTSTSTSKASLIQLLGNDVKPTETGTGQKTTKRNLKNEQSQPLERSNSDLGNEYRALRRKYLLLEEESFALGTELKEVQDEVKTLEDDKLALLDQLVVLEGLITPEVQLHSVQ